MQGVEPAARLVDRLADVIGRELRLELLLVLERIVPLGIGHRARDRTRHRSVRARGHLPPHSVQGYITSSTYGRCRSRSVRSRPLLSDELLDRADAVAMVAVGAHPDGQRRAPVALAAQRPVDVVLQPVAEAAFLDMLRHPVDGVVQRDQAILERWCGCTTSRGHSTSAACRSASRRDRYACRSRGGTADRGPQILDDLRVGVLEEHTAPRG